MTDIRCSGDATQADIDAAFKDIGDRAQAQSMEKHGPALEAAIAAEASLRIGRFASSPGAPGHDVLEDILRRAAPIPVSIPTLRILRVHPDAKVPAYQSAAASGLDLHARLDLPVRLWPGERAKIPTGIAIGLPDGWEAQVRPRSGLTLGGLTVHLGTIDADYRGEIAIIVEATSDANVSIEIRPGDRVAQLVPVWVLRLPVVEVEALDETARGASGFGSSGR